MTEFRHLFPGEQLGPEYTHFVSVFETKNYSAAKVTERFGRDIIAKRKELNSTVPAVFRIKTEDRDNSGKPTHFICDVWIKG